MKLSQTMIVKNEEKNIERALSWGKGIVSEQIVVDTGSTDRTVELAEKMGAKVYHFEWINDFSAAKNYAIEKCSGDWIAFLDADEYFKEDAENILHVIEKAASEGAYVIAAQLLNLNDEGKIIGSMTQARFFKNHEGIKYNGRVHEHLISGHRINIYDATKELSIFHTGYSESSHADKKKDEAYKLMLEKEIDESPDNADNYGYLGDIYAGERNYEKAEELYLKAVEMMNTVPSDESGRRGNTLRNLLIIIGGYNYRSDDLLKIYEFARLILPHDADFSCAVGEHFYRFQQYHDAASYYNEALKLYEEFGAYLKSDYVDSHLLEIYLKLANAYFLSKEYPSAIKTAIQVLKLNKYNTEMIRTFLLSVRDANMLGMKGYGLSEELVLLKQLYDFESVKDKAFLFVLTRKLGLEEISEQIKYSCSEAEKKMLEKL